MRICIVGEAWGEQEALTKRPFVGPAGQELTKILTEAGLDRSACYLTNVFNFRPENNDIGTLCIPKVDAIKALSLLKQETPDYPWPASYSYQALGRSGQYLHPKYLPGLSRLNEELSRGWELVIALGNTAMWAILGNTGISRSRGYLVESNLCPGAKVMPTFHPSAVLRKWALRGIVVADLIKARRAVSGEKVRPKEIWIEPSLEDIKKWFSEITPDQTLCIDIETLPTRRHITCVGFGTTERCISIPFWDRRSKDGSYWKSLEEEVAAWKLVRYGLELPNPKTWQNGLYDIQWLWRFLGMTPLNSEHDTMLLHHALHPEMQKDLEFLGSIYTEQPAWKALRKRAKLSIVSEKADD